ncbi:hypothetical protein [Enhydrobacter sp.]|jgi:hypothetical protein|uniref:hypothetical protein n=1 Tax=Enhydrobacter sp. TaxID=1894999 RepID=UPI00262B579E|nr:hypothetical protein [Enhydrobacter sp.]WIM09854.1 MAG: hypothetical protein OJF58_000807 [Enhydrobacter sp.]
MATHGGKGTWLIVALLLALLGLALVILYEGWGIAGGKEGTAMSTNGWIAMILGILATLGLGIGLMALIFYSHRHGKD